MTMLIEEKPSLDELLHYGVKGMRWGVRKDRSSSAGPSRWEKRRARDQEIKDARARQASRQGETLKAEAALYNSVVTGGRKEAVATLRERQNDYFKNPDYALAAKKTTGEKAVATMLVAYGAGILAYNIAGAAALNKLSAPAPADAQKSLGYLLRAKKNRQGVYNITSRS